MPFIRTGLKNMESNITYIKDRLDVLCKKIEKRMNELGDIDIMTYRSDKEINDIRDEICVLYRKAIKFCNTYKEAEKVCDTFKKYPGCLNQLMLSEELSCPT